MSHLKQLLELGSKITGSVTAATATDLIFGGGSGTAVVAAEALVKTGIKETVRQALADIANRQLSSREEMRVGAAATFAVNKVWSRLLDKETPRQDDFFSSSSQSEETRSPAEEIFEGSLLKCKNEHQEKKLRHIATIFANVAFRQDVSPELANQVLLIAERLSYRQLCMIAIIAMHDELDFDSTTWNKSSLLRFGEGKSTRPRIPGEYAGFVRELLAFSSEREALLSYSRESMTGAHGSETGTLTELGKLCFELMSLDEIEQGDLKNLIEQFQRITDG